MTKHSALPGTSTPAPKRALATAFHPAPSIPRGTLMHAASDIGAATHPGTGARIHQYELIRELGRGGMGAVFLARDTRLGRRVAIKLLHSVEPEMTERFILEARATARCSHENIVVIHDVGEVDNRPFMVLEYLQGTTLKNLLGSDQVLSPSRAVELMVPVARALACAHAHDIVHRDLKPDNIFVTESGAVKVLDFGIAKLVHQSDSLPAPGQDSGLIDGAGEAAELTRRGALVGTLPYMSPEQWGAAEIDHRTDIWAAGIILFRMVTGKHPLAPLRGWKLSVTGMIDEPMPGVREAAPHLPDELADIIDRCLQKRKDERMAGARQLLDALESLVPGRRKRTLRADQCPYAGLSAFQENDANRFFGRSHAISALVTRLRDQPMVAVVGPSGAGKSSFVRAGVVPALKQSDQSWETLVVRPGRHPMAALAHLVAPMMSSVTNSSPPKNLDDDLSEHQAVLARLHAEPGYLGTVLRSRARRQGRRILLFVDQFEELYTLSDDVRERMATTAALAGVADDATTPLRVVLSIRSDFLDRVGEDQRFMAELSHSLFFLAPPSREGLRDALVQPAEMAGFHFESPGMVDHMLDNLEDTSGALPLLQFAATQLWEMRDKTRRLLTRDSYQQIGGIVGALASHANTVLAELPPRSQHLVRAIFLRLVTPERTRAIASMDELCELSRDPGEVTQLLHYLVRARLLVVQTGDSGESNSASVEIVHESLIHGWDRLRRWLDDNHDDAIYLAQLRAAAKQWHAKGYAAGLLWRGEAMEEARRWYRRYRGELSGLQKSYLEAVFALAARSRRRKRLLIAATMGVLIAMVAAAGVALVLIRDAERQATEQARMARVAEKHVREKLAEVKAAVRARDKAKIQATQAYERVVAAEGALARKNKELERNNTALQDALARAERGKRRASRAERRSRRALREARVAKDDLQSALARVEQLLAQERARARRLESQLGTLIDQLY